MTQTLSVCHLTGSGLRHTLHNALKNSTVTKTQEGRVLVKALLTQPLETVPHTVLIEHYHCMVQYMRMTGLWQVRSFCPSMKETDLGIPVTGLTYCEALSRAIIAQEMGTTLEVPVSVLQYWNDQDLRSETHG